MGCYSTADGKVIWPVPHEGIDINDAYETLYAFAKSSLGLSIYDKEGNKFSGNLTIDVISDYEKFFETPLIDLIREQFDGELDDINGSIEVLDWPLESLDEDQAIKYNKSMRLIARLYRAYNEWEETDNKMSWEELKANPLPAIEKKEGVK